MIRHIAISALGTALLLCQPLPAQTSDSLPPYLAGLSDSFRQLTRRVHPTVVKVVATGWRALEDEDAQEPGFTARQQSSGSGVIVSPDGYVITNAHVVAGAQRVQVILTTSTSQKQGLSAVRPAGRVLRAQVVGFDNETDLAVLRVTAANLPALSLANSDDAEQGQLVFAFGSPLGLDNSVSMGVISSTARQLKPDDSMIYLQTDAPINPGSSGGPLVDVAGRLLGISTLILSQSGGNEGLGFGVPSNIVASVFEQIKKYGRVVRGEIGIHVQSITPLLAEALKLPQDWGVLVSDVEEGSAADRAGIQVGDVIRSLQGKTMENARQFVVNTYQPAIGSTVAVELLRGNKPVKATVMVSERRETPDQISAQAVREENLVPELGVFVLDLTDRLQETYGPSRKANGVLVASRSAEGPIVDDGPRAGDIIYAVNRTGVKSVQGLRQALRTLRSGDPIALQVERAGKLRYLVLELP